LGVYILFTVNVFLFFGETAFEKKNEKDIL